MFDVTMGSYDGAKVCELVGLFILNELSKTLGKDTLHRILDEQFGLKITAINVLPAVTATTENQVTTHCT